MGQYSVGLLTTAIGIAFFVLAGRQIALVFRARGWPTTRGKITLSLVLNRSDADSDSYAVNIAYEYTVSGQTFIGNGPRVGFGTGSRRAAERLCKKYPQGSRVTVHYDPTNPRRSVVETGISMSVVMNLLIAILFTASGIIVIAA